MTETFNYRRITKVDDLKRLSDVIMEKHDGKLIGFDLETGYHGPDREKGAVDQAWDKQFIAGFSLSLGGNSAFYVPVLHDYGDQIPPDVAWPIVKPFLERNPLSAHNMKFEIRNCRMLEKKGHGPRIDLNCTVDTMIDGYVLSEWQSVGLKQMVKDVYGHEMANIESLYPGWTAKKLKSLRFNVLELTPEVTNYACEDALWAWRLAQDVSPRAEAERQFMRRLEMETVWTMIDVEEWGVYVDKEAMEEARLQAAPFMAAMDKAVRAGLGAMAGRSLHDLSMNSPMQMQKLLYSEIGLSTTRMTKGADSPKNAGKEPWQKMSTDAIALEGLSKKHPAIQKLLDMREAQNMANRLDKWLDEYVKYYPDQRVHPNFAQTVVGTGRFAANDPPIQQCPKDWRWTPSFEVGDPFKEQEAWELVRRDGVNGKDYWEGNFREFIAAAPGWYLLTYDYSQIELRVLAGVSQEPALLKAFENDEDVHTLTAAMMLNIRPEQVSPQDRAIGKTQNFALLYQMGPKSLAERLGKTMAEAKELYANYFKQFASITTWMDRARALGKARGYAETPFGRKYTIWELQSSNNAIYAKGERVCINAPIQGGAADYMKIAMTRVRKELQRRGWWGVSVMMVMNQHDSLTFEVRNDMDPNLVRQVIQEQVVFPVKGFPKIVADWELGYTWGGSAKWKDGKEAFLGDDGRWALREAQGTPVAPVQQPAKVHAEEPAAPPVEAPGASEEYTEPLAERPEEVVHPEPATNGSGATSSGIGLVVELPEMPSVEAYSRFIDTVLRKHPGSNTVTLATPEGDFEIESPTTSLGVQDIGTFAMIFPGATVRQDASTIDSSALAAGLNL